MRLTPDEQDSYQRDGFLVRDDVFAADEITEMARHSEELLGDLERAEGRSGKKVRVSEHYVFEMAATEGVIIKWEPGSIDTIQGIEPFAHLTPYFTKLGDHPGFVDPMRDLVAAEAVALFTEKLNVKRAHVGGSFALHRDFPYWDNFAEDAEHLATAWVAIDDATADNGALEVLPGSHLIAQSDLPFKDNPEKPFEHNEVDPERFDTSGLMPVEVKAGAVIFFGPHLIHRSAANRSDRDRRALLYTYQRAGLRTSLDNLRRRQAAR